MSSAQVHNAIPAATPAYAFLSKPPQKKRPAYPPPAIPRTAAHSAIASWAALVQPGSPGSPHSLRRRRSVSSRRTPTPSRSFFLVETPPAADKEFAVDLTELGYTSVFVHLPKTPATPAQFVMNVDPNSFPVPPTPARAAPLKRLRSFSILRSRTRSASTSHGPASPTKSSTHHTPKPRSPTNPKHESPQLLAASIAQRKKAAYAHSKHAQKHKNKPATSKPQLPPSLAAEIALMQFADGGSAEANIRRLMEAHARAAAPAGTKSGDVAVGDVYRDGKGGVWWDREEEMEYVHLLGGHTSETSVAGPGKWVSFGGEVKDGKDCEEDGEGENAALALASLADAGGRRDSATSTASATSSLDPCNVVKPAEEDAAVLRVPRIPLAPVAAPSQAQRPTAPLTIAHKEPKRRPAPEPLLTVPSRPRTAHHHLRASPNFFLLDLNAFTVPATPRTPRTPRTPASPYPLPTSTSTLSSMPPRAYSHGRTRASPVRTAFAQTQRARGAARRRPAPLKIAAHVPMRGVSPELDAEDVVMLEAAAQKELARRDFLEASFEPAAVPRPEDVHVHVPNREGMPVRREEKTLKKKTSRPILALFGRK